MSDNPTITAVTATPIPADRFGSTPPREASIAMLAIEMRDRGYHGTGSMSNGDSDAERRADNNLRAFRATDALGTYADATFGERYEEAQYVIRDFLVDLRHVCAVIGVDFDALADSSADRYGEETDPE